MRAYVAVTDGDWFRFLRGLAGIDEVNFWQPGGERAFGRLEVGQPFLFKLRYPEHISFAWQK
jgi:putative restriction endonuclease